MVNHKFEETIEGVPQGGPLSPILSNIILNELDSELSRRGHRFVRYADDCMILVKSLRAAERVKESIATFVEKKLFLRVNKEKTVVGPLVGKKFLGYSFYFSKDGKIGLTVHKKSKDKFHRELKTITNRSNGKGYLWLKKRLTEYVRGWFDYYYLADMKSFLNKTEKWYRRRIRSYIWKCWKGVRTRFVNLIKCGISREQAWQWANTRKGYWRIAGSWILHTAITNERLVLQGYPSLLGIYTQLHRN